MPREKKSKHLPATTTPPLPALTLAEACELKRQYRLSSLLTHADSWRLFYSDERRAGYADDRSRHEQEFEDELQANQYFHRLRSEWLAKPAVPAQ